MVTAFVIITFITITNCQPYEPIYTFDCNTSPSGWNIVGTVAVVNTCPNSTECWDLHAESTATKVISTFGYHQIKLFLDVSIAVDNGKFCIVEYSTDATHYNVTASWTEGAPDLINSEFILPDVSDINNASNFEIKLSNTATHHVHDHCYFDNIKLYGIPYTLSPTSNPTTISPTRNPTTPSIAPTNNPSITPTLQPSKTPTKSPTPSPILIVIPTPKPTIAPTHFKMSTTYFEMNTTVLSATKKSDGIFSMERIVIIIVIIAVICICILVFLRKRNKTLDSEAAKTRSFLEDTQPDFVGGIPNVALQNIHSASEKNVNLSPIQTGQFQNVQVKKQSEIRCGELTPANLNMTNEKHKDNDEDYDDDDLSIINDIDTSTKGGSNQIEDLIDNNIKNDNITEGGGDEILPNSDVEFGTMISDNAFAQDVLMDDIVMEMDATPGNMDNCLKDNENVEK